MIDSEKVASEAAAAALLALEESAGWRIRFGEDFAYGAPTKYWEVANSGTGQSARLNTDGVSFWISSPETDGELNTELQSGFSSELLGEILRKVAVRDSIQTRRGIRVKIGRKAFDLDLFLD